MVFSHDIRIWARSLARRRRFKKRYDVINYFVRKGRYARYLEIGVRSGTCFKRVQCTEKVGVDPEPETTDPSWHIERMSSDDFFGQNERFFDLVFIDGLHLAEQALRDLANSLRFLSEDGVVLLHDCNPLSEQAQSRESSVEQRGGHWNGDVWKAITYVRKFCPTLFCRVLDLDEGVGVVLPLDPQARSALNGHESRAREFFDALSWSDLEADRKTLLGLISGRRELENELRG